MPAQMRNCKNYEMTALANAETCLWQFSGCWWTAVPTGTRVGTGPDKSGAQTSPLALWAAFLLGITLSVRPKVWSEMQSYTVPAYWHGSVACMNLLHSGAMNIARFRLPGTRSTLSPSVSWRIQKPVEIGDAVYLYLGAHCCVLPICILYTKI